MAGNLQTYVSKPEVEFLLKNHSFQEASDILKERFPGIKGFSERSLKRYCKDNNIIKNNMSKGNQIVLAAMNEVGESYGRKMLTGHLRAKGTKISEWKVGKLMRQINPPAQRRRQETFGRCINPKPYTALYFGQKLHIDQNEKLVMYGVTHVIARDGFSGYIAASYTMPVKNNLTIYEHILRKTIEKHGLWDQIRVDGGKEFYLSCFMQDFLRQKRTDTSLEPYKSTKSTENHVVERMWVEVNSRVNYPIKTILNHLVQTHIIDISDPTDKFCVSWVTTRVSSYGLSVFVNAWNFHNIPGKGVPNELMQKNNRAAKVPLDLVPTPAEAYHHYVSLRGRLKIDDIFGEDIIRMHEVKVAEREEHFLRYFDFKLIFEDIQKNGNQLGYAIAYFKDLTLYYGNN